MDEPTETNDSLANGADDQALGELKRRASRHEIQDEVPPGATDRKAPSRQANALELARVAARIAAENRAKDVVLLDLRASTPLFDYFVIATASSRRLANTVISDVDAEMKKRQELKLGMEGSEEGRWVLIDYGDFVVHVFSDEARAYYALEDIWGDAPRIDWQGDEPVAMPVAIDQDEDADDDDEEEGDDSEFDDDDEFDDDEDDLEDEDDEETES
jgi:ribosome-associated protein